MKQEYVSVDHFHVFPFSMTLLERDVKSSLVATQQSTAWGLWLNFGGRWVSQVIGRGSATSFSQMCPSAEVNHSWPIQAQCHP